MFASSQETYIADNQQSMESTSSAIPGTTTHIASRSDMRPAYGSTIAYPRVDGLDGSILSSSVPTRVLYEGEVKPAHPVKPSVNVFTRYFSEFLGTFLLAFTVACCPQGIWVPTAFAGTIVALTYVFAPISGANINPAVTLAHFLAGKMKLLDLIGYVIAQILGSILAVLLFRLCFGVSAFTVLVMPIPPFGFGAAAAVEMIYTTMLCFVGLNVTKSSTMDENHFYALAIGFVIVAGGYSSHDISCALFNPALSLAFSLNQHIGWGGLFVLVELGGGLIAALFFRICRRNEYNETHRFYEIESGAHHSLYDIPSLDPPSLRVRIFSEFLGTCWLLLTYGLNIIFNTGATAWAAAAALLSLMYALATVSGGHFNPAVTFGVVLSGREKCTTRDGCFYVIAQLVAAIPIGIFLAFIHSHGPTSKFSDGLFALESIYAWYQIVVAEALFTFLIVYVVLTVATSEPHTATWPNFYFALAIGFALVGASYASSNVSGGYLNPAVALSFAVEGQPSFTSDATVKDWPAYLDTLMRIFAIVFKFIDHYLRCFWYWIPELLGAAAAAASFRHMFSAEYERKMLG